MTWLGIDAVLSLDDPYTPTAADIARELAELRAQFQAAEDTESVRLCLGCGEQPRLYQGGRWRTYCRPCQNAVARAYEARRRAARRAP